MELVAYGGWRCARLTAGTLEALVTLDVGPRVIRFGEIGGPNEFYENPKHAGLTGGDVYRGYGGHRLWVAPECSSITYEPDNQPVSHERRDGWHWFTTPLGPTGLERCIGIRPEPDYPRFRLRHIVTNRRDEPIEIAAWALSVMRAGGTCVFPQQEFREHSEALLPARSMAVWHYTNMADERWTWGEQVVRLRQIESAETPQKVGAMVHQGCAAYSNEENIFFKRFAADPDARYPDLGCNFETFTRHDMLEVETLGPLVTLQPGESTIHDETWFLELGVILPDDDQECAEWLSRMASSHPLH